jgi:hypothetical protein
MNIPGFSAEASLYKTSYRYVTAHNTSPGSVIPQRISPQLDDNQLYQCQQACFYCHYGYYCWMCYVCGWAIALEW